MVYLSSYIDGKKGIDTLDGFSDNTLDYLKEIFDKYSTLSGYDGFSEERSNGNFWADLDISLTSKDSDSFSSILLSSYWIDGVNNNESVYDLYSLTFELNEENKFNLTEKNLYEDIGNYVNYYDGTSAFFNVYSDEDIKSLNLETGNYKTESVLTSNFEFYLGEENDARINDYQQTNNYGLIAGINDSDGKLIIVKNIEKENHSVLFEIEKDENRNTYIDDITENKNGTLHLVAGKSIWSYSDDHSIQEATESYELYTYNKDGTLNEIDLGTYDTYYEYKITDNNWEILERSYTSFFLWNDDDYDTWLVKEYQYENHTSNDAYSYYEGYVLDDDFNINNEANLTLRLEQDLDYENYVNINSRADNQGFTFGFIFSETQSQHEYVLDKSDRITKKIQEANQWDKINYSTYDWSEVDYDSFSEDDTENIKWNKVDLVNVLDSENFRFDAVDWQEVSEDGGINKEKAYDLINEFDFDEDNDLINLKYLSSVENIKAGGGNDSVTGNSLNNIFHGQGGKDTLKGDAGADKLYGESGEDTLYGDSGNDYLSGGSYKDKLYGGTGKDTLRGGTNSDKLYGESGEDTLYGDSGNDYLSGGSYKDKLYGGSGKDTLRGGTNSDKLYGGSSADKLYGDSGNDYLNGGSSADKLYGGSGKDKLVGGTSNDRLYGGSSSDKLYGQSGKDYLRGDSGNDKLYGGSSNDTLIGGTGKDDVYGGSGRDIFKLTKGSGYDRIRDFKKRSDKIYVKGFKSLRIKDVGRHTKIYNGRKDLLAIVYNEDNLRKSGSYLI